MFREKYLPALLFAFANILFISCSGTTEEARNTRPPMTANSTPAAANSKANMNASSPASSSVNSGEGFSVASVCSLPRNLSGGSPFASLGGGLWERWDETENGLNYSCNGGTDSLKLEEVVAKIRAGYTALGDQETVHVVSATYIALQYGGKTKEESGLRPKYLDFCNALARSLYGQPLPEKFRNRVMDDSTYAEGDGPEYTEKVGSGLVSLNARKEKTDMLRLEVNFFPSEADYKKFKDS